MNKNINYLLEFLAKYDKNDNQQIYIFIVNFFKEHYIYTSTKYDLKTLKLLATRSGFMMPSNSSIALKELDKNLELVINLEIKEAKIQLLSTLLSTNFPKQQKYLKKSIKKFEKNLEKVDKKIYNSIMSYIFGLTRGLELFYVYTKNNTQELEIYIDFSNQLHNQLITLIFNDDEKKFLDKRLKEIMSVYLSVYSRYLYL